MQAARPALLCASAQGGVGVGVLPSAEAAASRVPWLASSQAPPLLQVAVKDQTPSGQQCSVAVHALGSVRLEERRHAGPRRWMRWRLDDLTTGLPGRARLMRA